MAPTLTQLPERTLDLGDREVSVRVRTSDKARTSRILVGPQRPLEIIVPDGTPEARITDLLTAKRDWIARKLAAAQEVNDRPAKLGLDTPGVVWLNGERIARRDGDPAKPSAARRDGDMLTVDGPGTLAEQAVQRWYRREARAAIRAEAEAAANRLDLTYRSVTVRDQRTRWGSCSPAGNLSFNWRLIVAPELVRHYVVIHELCHLQVPNHSKQFWTLLEAAEPEWRAADRWLAEHGPELQAYRRAAEAARLGHSA